MESTNTIYFTGEKLFGDDFTLAEIEAWFEDEAEGYADLGSKDQGSYRYVYHALNKRHGFRHIKNRTFDKALGFGSAYGNEFEPIADQLNHITILDPSDAFADVTEILSTPCTYIRPQPDGDMPFADNQFDLVTSLGVLHHIPNVSHVLSECYRCLQPGGVMLLREPITSMGDWNKPRKGLTKRERGIPLNILVETATALGFKVKAKSLCIFPLLPRLTNPMGVASYNNYIITAIDSLLSKAFAWNNKYHRPKTHEKFSATSVFLVLEK